MLFLRRALSLAAVLLLSVSLTVAVGPSPAQAAGPTFTNPVVDTPNSADPTLVHSNGFYYYVATTWSSTVVMRKASTIAGLQVAAEQVVVNTGGTSMWAPHLEQINGRWYLYYSVEQSGGARRTHVAESAGADPLGPYTIRGILNLMPNNGWAIDAGVLKLNGANYLMFSAFEASDNLQSLFIAPLTNPWTAGAFGTRISAPTLAWETQNGAVNEGPFALQRNGRTFLTYSASHCQGPNYKIGMLEYTGTNPLSASSWTKAANPLFQRSDANGVYGPAHHSFFTSPDGTETWIAYHANASATQGCGTTRTTRVQKISWNSDGTPNLGVPVSTNTILAAPSGENATVVEIRNQHSGLCLDDYNWLTAAGAEVRQWTCSTAAVQDWFLTPTADGFHQISNRHSGLCLDDKEWATAAGSVIQQWPCNGLAVQQWRVTTDANGWSTIQNRHSGLCLDDYNLVTTPGAEVRQWTCLGNNAQRWRIA
ncbi:glycosyl hydrolase [Actinoplanes sp. ATCC 53533]|uniref:family 43 glycosylhydrolase n=1 Tax=Actinoplanes sp. ATCC 53533 TaxID=1288362 RepID=UPI000F793D9E|nr:family 43 glycosylhydrolase [Actinoplanes sp. ATCC 53533]RSM72243.1 glycosyl hydrolase [Actinoplanes sp. ATCC 53533]